MVNEGVLPPCLPCSNGKFCEISLLTPEECKGKADGLGDSNLLIRGISLQENGHIDRV